MAYTVTLISKRAKQIRHKNEPWTEAIERASKQLKKEGKIGKTKSSTRQTGHSNKKRDQKRHAKAPGKRKSKSGRTYYERRKNRSDVPGSMTGNTTKSRTHTDYNANEVNISVGGLKSALRKKYEEKLKDLFLRKEKAKLKREKNKLQKQITATRSELKKYQ